MSTFSLSGAATFLLATATWLLALRCRHVTRRTSLGTAWNWAQAAGFAWVLSSFLAVILFEKTPLLDQFWLWTAILTLCPFIAVLGARRPASNVWNWFILLPLMAVLGWPSLTVLGLGGTLVPLRVHAPVFVGFALVLLMGLGNYVGTRFTLAAMLMAPAVMLIVLPMSALLSLSAEAAGWCRLAGTLLAACAVLVAIRNVKAEPSELSRWDRIWCDFRDLFGIVWAIRIQERINVIAEKEKWACRIGPLGIEWTERMETDAGTAHGAVAPGAQGGQELAATEDKLEHALRWHLRRFVDPEWIDERINATEPGDQD